MECHGIARDLGWESPTTATPVNYYAVSPILWKIERGKSGVCQADSRVLYKMLRYSDLLKTSGNHNIIIRGFPIEPKAADFFHQIESDSVRFIRVGKSKTDSI